jgi:hypothetical protein
MESIVKRLMFFALAAALAASVALAQPNWSQAAPATSPSIRTFAAMAYDPLHQQVMLFGGCAVHVGSSTCTATNLDIQKTQDIRRTNDV